MIVTFINDRDAHLVIETIETLILVIEVIVTFICIHLRQTNGRDIHSIYRFILQLALHLLLTNPIRLAVVTVDKQPVMKKSFHLSVCFTPIANASRAAWLLVM